LRGIESNRLVTAFFKFTFTRLLVRAARRLWITHRNVNLRGKRKSRFFYKIFSNLRNLAARRVFLALCASKGRRNSPFVSSFHLTWLDSVLKSDDAYLVRKSKSSPAEIGPSLLKSLLLSRNLFFNTHESLLAPQYVKPYTSRIHFLISRYEYANEFRNFYNLRNEYFYKLFYKNFKKRRAESFYARKTAAFKMKRNARQAVFVSLLGQENRPFSKLNIGLMPVGGIVRAKV